MSFKTSPPAFVVAGLRKLAAGGIMSRQLRDLYRDAADIIERQAANHARLGDNYENAWAALRLVREAIETLGPVGALCSEEGTLIERGPEPVHEAETLVRGIQAIVDAASGPDMTPGEMREITGRPAPHPTERVPEVEIDDDGTIVLSWPGALDISILPSGKIIGTHSPATRGIKPWTAYDPGPAPATIEQSSTVGAEIRWLLAEFVRFAGDARRLDFNEDKTASWIAVMTDRATKALAAPVKDSLTTETDRQAIRAEAFREAAKVARERAAGWAKFASADDLSGANGDTVRCSIAEARDIATAIEALATPPETEGTI